MLTAGVVTGVVGVVSLTTGVAGAGCCTELADGVVLTAGVVVVGAGVVSLAAGVVVTGC